MKALLIADTDSSVRTISQYIKPYGFDTIRYRSAIKAIDNIEEIGPDAVFISTGDFPRHWKTIVQFIRSDTAKDKTVIILMINERFTADDADKAVYIGVQAIISENLTASNDTHQLLEVFSRYKHIGPDDQTFVYDRIEERAVFMFTNPLNDTIITGKVDGLSMKELRFKPDAPSATTDLSDGEVLNQCSLKLGSAILSPECRIKKNSNLMIFEFVNLNENETKVLKAFIAGE